MASVSWQHCTAGKKTWRHMFRKRRNKAVPLTPGGVPLNLVGTIARVAQR
jgi:hypothetical protein